MEQRRRHRLIWLAAAGLHIAALGAVWWGGGLGFIPTAPEGGFVMVTLSPEPVALPGEVPGGLALGAGLVLPEAAPSVAVSVAAPPVPSASPTPAAPVVAVSGVIVPGIAPAPVPTPVAMVFVPPAFGVRQEPAYPARARRAGTEGLVEVHISLGADGTVRRVRLARSSGSALLDEAALAAARASTFTPASRDRKPVEAEASASYRFELR